MTIADKLETLDNVLPMEGEFETYQVLPKLADPIETCQYLMSLKDMGLLSYKRPPFFKVVDKKGLVTEIVNLT